MEFKIGVYSKFIPWYFKTFPAGGWWVDVENEINANSAFNKVVVEVEAELGKIKLTE